MCSAGEWKMLEELNILFSQQYILLPTLHSWLIISEVH